MSVVNPYEFLGVTTESSLTEVRQAFFRLSLVCHPDKGGNNDDMRTLQSAYEWITHHIQTVKCHGTETYEEKEENFKTFLESQQVEKILPWDEILKDVMELQNEGFDELYNRHKTTDDDYTKKLVTHLFVSRLRCMVTQEVSHKHIQGLKEQLMHACVTEMTKVQNTGFYNRAAMKGGYGDYLESTPTDIDIPISETKSFGKKELIIYEAPTALSLPKPVGADIAQVESVEDYSTETLCDYRMAFQDTNHPLQKLEESLAPLFTQDVNAQFEELRRSMENLGLHPDMTT